MRSERRRDKRVAARSPIATGTLDGKQILKRETVEEMSRVQEPALDADQGLVWFYDEFGPCKRVLGHDGADNGVSAAMYFDPADGAGVIVMSNGMWASTTATDELADGLMVTLFEESKS